MFSKQFVLLIKLDFSVHIEKASEHPHLIAKLENSLNDNSTITKKNNTFEFEKFLNFIFPISIFLISGYNIINSQIMTINKK